MLESVTEIKVKQVGDIDVWMYAMYRWKYARTPHTRYVIVRATSPSMVNIVSVTSVFAYYYSLRVLRALHTQRPVRAKVKSECWIIPSVRCTTVGQEGAAC